MTQDCCRRGRGRVSFTPAILQNGTIDTTPGGWGTRWGQNWGGVGNGGYVGGNLRMPMGIFIGAVEEMLITPEVEDLGDKVDWTGDGAEDCSGFYVNGAMIKLTLKCHSAANLIGMLYGEQQGMVSGPQQHIVQLAGGIPAGTTVFLPQRVDDAQPFTITTSWGGALTLGADYSQRPFGPLFDNGLAVPGNASSPQIVINYVALPTVQIETLQQQRGGFDVGVVYDGINLHGGSPIRDDIYHVRFKPADSFGSVNKDDHKLMLQGQIMSVNVGGKKRRWRTWPGA